MDIDIEVHLDRDALRKLIKRVAQDDDANENDLSWWKPAFEVLKPQKVTAGELVGDEDVAHFAEDGVGRVEARK
jgi:hypothetical protein